MESKMKKIILVLAALMLLPGYTFAGYPFNKSKTDYGQNQKHDFQKKGANFDTGYGNIIIGYPVTDLGLKYYYAIRDDDTYDAKAKNLSEEDIEAIAEKTAEITVQKLLEKLKS